MILQAKLKGQPSEPALPLASDFMHAHFSQHLFRDYVSRGECHSRLIVIVARCATADRLLAVLALAISKTAQNVQSGRLFLWEDYYKKKYGCYTIVATPE